MSFWNKTNKKVSLVCDIGSASVTLALVDFSPAKPLVLFSTKVPILIQLVYKPKLLAESLLSYIDKALSNIENKKKEGILYELKNIRPETAHIVFSSPWYVSKVVTSNIVKDKPTLLDRKFFDSVMDDEEKKFETEISSSPRINILGDIHAIERELFQVKVNGYPTNTPLMKKAQKIETSIMVSVVPHNLYIDIASKVERVFNCRRIYAHSFPYSAWNALLNLSKHENDYVLLDIAGEMTDIVIVKENIINKIYSVESGRNALIRALAEKLDCPVEIALSTLSLYTSGVLDDITKNKIEDALKTYMAVWRFKIDEATGGMLFAVTSYRKFFVTIDDDVADPFIGTLKNSIGDERAVFQITNDLIGDVIDYNKHVTRDPFIAIETVFLEKLYRQLPQ